MGKTMLWQSNQVPHVLFLGSIHVLKGELPGWVLAAHDQADAAVFEANLREVPPPPSMPNGLRLEDLDPQLWALVRKKAARLQIGNEELEALATKYPFTVSTELGLAAFRSSGATFEQGPDRILMELRPDYLFLEKVDEFYSLTCEGPAIEEQMNSLRHTILTIDRMPDRLEAATERWRDNDPDGVLEALGYLEKFSDFPEIAAGLFTKRHALWLPHALRFIRRAHELREKLLFVVGCAHLTGPQSFLADIEAQTGWHFEQV